MSVRDHHNPFLRERRKLDRERRQNARKNRHQPDARREQRERLADPVMFMLKEWGNDEAI